MKISKGYFYVFSGHLLLCTSAFAKYLKEVCMVYYSYCTCINNNRSPYGTIHFVINDLGREIIYGDKVGEGTVTKNCGEFLSRRGY